MQAYKKCLAALMSPTYSVSGRTYQGRKASAIGTDIDAGIFKLSACEKGTIVKNHTISCQFGKFSEKNRHQA